MRRYERLKAVLEARAPALSHHEIKGLTSTLHEILEEKYPSRKGRPKYGSLNMAFNDEELLSFMLQLPGTKFELIFKYQAYMGLRISEACRLKASNIRVDTRELVFESAKKGGLSSLLIPYPLFSETLLFIEAHRHEIEQAQGHIFYKDNDNNGNMKPHIDPEYARRVFRESRARAGLQEIYGYSDERALPRPRRPLYRLSSHSLRRYAVTKFHKLRRDLVLTSRFARHSSPKETIKYVAQDHEELYQDIDAAFARDVQQKALLVGISEK